MFYIYSIRDDEGEFAVVRKQPLAEGVTESGEHEVRFLMNTESLAAAIAQAQAMQDRERARRATRKRPE